MRLNIKVKTNTSQQKLIIKSINSAEAWLKAKPVEGKANEALVDLVAGHFNTKRNKVQILKGHKSRQKIVEIRDE